MNDFLKNLASLTGSELSIYSLEQKQQDERAKVKTKVKKRGRPLGSTRQKLHERRENELKMKQAEEAAAETVEPEQEEDDEEIVEEIEEEEESSSLEAFDYKEYAQSFPTICEADYEYSKGLELLRNEENENAMEESESESEDVSDPESESEYDEVLTAEESQEFLASLPKIAKTESIARRFGYGTENPNSLRNRMVEEFFNRTLMARVFEKNLERTGDRDILGKLKGNFGAMVTLKGSEEMFNAVRLHLYQIILETDALISQMDSIYSRARTQAPLVEVSLDCKRFRNFKTQNPTATLPDVLAAFHANQTKPRFVNRFHIRAEVVQEAGRRIGADNYGASVEFSNLFDLITDEELVAVSNNVNNPVVPSTTSLDFDKLQDAIKRALESKLNKNKI